MKRCSTVGVTTSSGGISSHHERNTRFRIFYPNEYEIVPRVIVDVMAALGAWRVWAGNAAACGSYDYRERREVHYLWPEGHPVENSFKIGSRVLPLPSRRTVDELATFAIGWSSRSTRTSVRTSNREPDAPSTKQWQSRCSKGRSLRGAVSLGELV